MRLNIRIDRLVLTDGGLGERDVEVFRHALQVELGRLLAGNPSSLMAGHDHRTIASMSTTLAAPLNNGRRLGQGIARTISGALQ